MLLVKGSNEIFGRDDQRPGRTIRNPLGPDKNETKGRIFSGKAVKNTEKK
jgi:hypothetical protein